MGLDVTAYSKLAYANPQPTQEEAEENYGDYTQLYDGEYYKRLQQPEGYYAFQEGSDSKWIACGSYGRYSHWRNNLAKFSGWPLDSYDSYGTPTPSYAAAAWHATEGPFWELIAFSDCEGTIGTEVAKKLLADFEKHREAVQEAARQTDEHEYFLAKYEEWYQAFLLAADGGAVKFH